VILDVDGTLVDSNDAHARSWLEAFAEHGITVAYEDVRRSIGMGGDKLMPDVSGIEEDSEEGRRIADSRVRIFKNRWLPGLRAFPCTRELLRRFLDSGFTLAVATSAKQEELQPLLQTAGLDDLVSLRTSSDDASNSKPDPDIVSAAVTKSGCSPGRAIMLGDTPYDVEAARKAGVHIVALECGGWSGADLRGADEIYADAAELLRRYETSIFARLATASTGA
jgi:phosphoglycolate phosphatase-like HAD superfamily hydrolase